MAVVPTLNTNGRLDEPRDLCGIYTATAHGSKEKINTTSLGNFSVADLLGNTGLLFRLASECMQDGADTRGVLSTHDWYCVATDARNALLETLAHYIVGLVCLHDQSADYN